MKDEYTFQNVLVTGGCGFTGSNIINYFVERYPHVKFVNLDCLYYCASEKNITVMNRPNYVFVEGNITDYSMVYEILCKQEIDTVLHFAAKTHVDESLEYPERCIVNNIQGTFTLLEACRKYDKVKRFIYVSTDEVFGDNRSKGETIMNEDSALNPTNPYSASKASAELLAQVYHISYKLPIIIVRCNNIYGPQQYPEKVIPKFIIRLQHDQPCQIHGSGQQSRVFIFIDDVIRAYETILKRGVIGEKYNIGNDEKYSVLEIAKKIIKFMKPDDLVEEWMEFVPDRLYNDVSYNISWEKLASLGWHSQTPLDEGLSKVVKWYSDVSISDHWINSTMF